MIKPAKQAAYLSKGGLIISIFADKLMKEMKVLNRKSTV